MNSLKTAVVCIILLGVLYGMYQVINTPDPYLGDDPYAEELEIPVIQDGTPVDPHALSHSDGMPGGNSLTSDQAPYLVDQGAPADPVNTQVPESSTGQSNSQFTKLDAPGSLTGSNPPAGVSTGQLLPSNSDIFGDSAKANLSGQNPDRVNTPPAGFASNQNQTPPSNTGSAAGADLQIHHPTETLGLAWSSVEAQINQQNYRQALQILSAYYGDPRLSSEDQQNLLAWLDPLAAKVIYSTEDLMERFPYIVRQGDSLVDIGKQYGVPAQLIYNINRNKIDNPNMLIAGTELKVIRGPFEARVSLSQHKLALFVGGLYAGQFDIQLGSEPQPQVGAYRVINKIGQGREYYASNGAVIPANATDNPFGRVWIDLGSGHAIHGSPANRQASDRRGCISLKPADAADIFGILSISSEVRILR